jgi:predicted DNA-binding protein (UPF0251 family)/predicted Fe-Mo cluster-binding NifX family protein
MRGRKKVAPAAGFKAAYNDFFALNSVEREVIEMEQGELYALLLADFCQLYQEECALRLGVSRPTFSRIIERARKKVSVHLITGKPLAIRKDNASFTVAYPSADRFTIAKEPLEAPYFVLAAVDNDAIESMRFIGNPQKLPLIAEALKNTSIILLPNSSSADSLQSSLLESGVAAIRTDKTTLEEWLKRS